jgi:hypothetical protein
LITITMDPLKLGVNEEGHMVDVVEPFLLHMFHTTV